MPDITNCHHVIQRIWATDTNPLPCAECSPSFLMTMEFMDRYIILEKKPVAVLSMGPITRYFWWPRSMSVASGHSAYALADVLRERLEQIGGDNPFYNPDLGRP